MAEIIYKIKNSPIVLKLEKGKTNIYINNEKFNQCKYLLLNFNRETLREYNELTSIDEVSKLYSKKNESNKTIINPKTEFIGHCSNLEAWVENNYSLDILHSSLSFPLLSKLTQLKDQRAKIFLKEQIFEKIEKGNEKVLTYFLNEGYLHLFTHEELQLMFDMIDIERQDTLKIINKLMYRKWLVEKAEKKGHQKIIISEKL